MIKHVNYLIPVLCCLSLFLVCPRNGFTEHLPQTECSDLVSNTPEKAKRIAVTKARGAMARHTKQIKVSGRQTLTDHNGTDQFEQNIQSTASGYLPSIVILSESRDGNMLCVTIAAQH